MNSVEARWTLSGQSASSSSDVSLPELTDEYVFARDEQLGVLYLTVNGEPAKSKRTGDAYDKPVVGVRRRDDMMEFTLEDGKSVKLPVANADLEALSQQFQGDENFTVDDLTLQPQFQSTPKPLAEPRRKRQKITLGSTHSMDSQGKFRGVVEVPIRNVKKAANGVTLVEGNHARVESFKRLIQANKGFHLPVLPVMVAPEYHDEWQQENAEKVTYHLLGGISIWEALLDLCSDKRYSCYERVLVKVHEGLTPMEALQVGALFQQEQSLLVDEAPTLQSKVVLCRRLLYALHKKDETEEPPTSISLDWRPQAAAAMGVVASSRKELKRLESTFQLALYSKRCYEKLMRLFSWYEEEYGKPMKQSIFAFLQGLMEVDKFNILTKLVNGSLKVEQVKLEAARLKRLGMIKQVFLEITNKTTWEECCDEFPAHTQPSALDHFLDMDFKKSVPRDFIEFIKEAQKTAENGSSSFEHLRMEPVSLAIIQVESKQAQKMKRVLENLKSGTTHVAVLADGLELAAAWQAEMRKQGFHLLQESSVVKETHVCHLITATTDKGTTTKLPRIIADDRVFRTLIQTFSERGDNIGIGGELEELSDIVTSMGRQTRVIHRGKLPIGNARPQDITESNATDSDATDLDATDV